VKHSIGTVGNASETPRRWARTGCATRTAESAEIEARQDRRSRPDAIVERLPVAQIRPIRSTRKEFAPAELADLAIASGRRATAAHHRAPCPAHGGRHTGGIRFEILAGERRYRAAVSLGWTRFQRSYEGRRPHGADAGFGGESRAGYLNPIDEAEGYARLVHEFSLTSSRSRRRSGRTGPPSQHPATAQLTGAGSRDVARRPTLLDTPGRCWPLARSARYIRRTGHSRPRLTVRDVEESEGRKMALLSAINEPLSLTQAENTRS